MDERLISLLERTAAALEPFADAGHGLQVQAPSGATASHPTFAGYMASWAVDAAGYLSYIATVDGELAYKHERQGDVWWSVSDETADGGYRRVLTIKIGETLPPEACWKPPTSPKEAETQGLPGPETPKEWEPYT